MLTLSLFLGLMPEMGLTAYAGDLSETLTTTSSWSTAEITGDHFKVNGQYGTVKGLFIGSSNNYTYTITALNGETIKKVELTIGDMGIGDWESTNIISTSGQVEGNYEENGTLTLKNANDSTITLSADSNHSLQVKTCKIYYEASDVAVTGVTINPSTAAVTVDDKVALTASIEPDNATDKTVKWLFDNKVKLFSDADCTSPITTDTETNILTVYVKGISEGVDDITVVSNTNAVANAQCEVTFAPTTAISPAGAGTVSFTGGTDLQFKATANSGYKFDHWSYSELAYNPTTQEQQWTKKTSTSNPGTWVYYDMNYSNFKDLTAHFKADLIPVTTSKPAEEPAPADEEKGAADFKPSAAAPDVKGVKQEAIKTQMEELAKADDTKLKAGQVKDVTVNMETKAVAESDVPKTEASAIKETAEGVIPAKDRESTKCDFLDIAVSKIVIVYDVKNGKKVKNESDSISTNLTKLAQVIDIPVKYDLTGKCNPLIVRYHNGKAEAFQRLYAAPAKDALKDGTYYVEGAGENAIVHIYTDSFSTYALLTSGTEEYPRSAEEDDGGKDGDSITVYRLYYAATREHFYTTGLHEKNTLVEKYGWIYEGIAWKSPVEPKTDKEKETIKPVYRLYNPFTTDHHYTDSLNEKNTLVQKYGWKDEGVAFYANIKGKATVYRLWKEGLMTGAHHFTTSKYEYDVLVSRGWVGESVAFKVNAEG